MHRDSHRVNVTLALVLAAAGAARAQSATPRLITLPAPVATVPAEFTRATSVRELADGRLLIVDWSDQKVFVAGRSNAEVQQLGRNGSGPGEYLQPGTLFAIGGDSTVLADSRNGRWLIARSAFVIIHARSRSRAAPAIPTASIAASMWLIQASRSASVKARR